MANNQAKCECTLEQKYDPTHMGCPECHPHFSCEHCRNGVPTDVPGIHRIDGRFVECSNSTKRIGYVS